VTAKTDRWRRIGELCDRALALGPGERPAFLASACAGDDELRREVESLLSGESKVDGFLRSSTLQAVVHDVMSAPGSLTGSRIGAYEVRAWLGAGGMGEVYRARDIRLGRDVAVKVLPPHLTSDPERLARFEREARLLASLNHPHIATIHGIEEAAPSPDTPAQPPTRALILELVEGETLAARLERGALKPDQALGLAIQMAEALDHAHRRGITHRDLKPANVMLTKSSVKLLDFGLAKWRDPRRGYAARSASGSGATVTPGVPSVTEEGTILGTLHYMAPEQLEGKDVDARADLFAFGAVLFEMLTGRKAFDGDSQATVIAAVLGTEPPPLSSVQAQTPPALERVVRKCLAKDPDLRWQTARDLADQLKWTVADDATVETGPKVRRLLPARAAAATAAIGVALAAWTGWMLAPSRESQTPRAVTRFVLQPQTPLLWDYDISPDGRQIVYAGSGRGPSAIDGLFIRRLDQFDITTLTGTEGAGMVAFSPDGEWVAFVARGKLQKINVRAAAAPIVLCDAPDPIMGGMTWTTDDTIFFMNRGEGAQRVSAEGGEPVRVTRPEANPPEVDHHTPELLPDGQALLFTIHAGEDRFKVALHSLASGQRKVLIDNGFDAHYSPSGHIVFARGAAILAAPFDVRRLEVTGAPVILVDRVATRPRDGWGNFRLSKSGTLVFQAERSIAGRLLTWVDRSGAETPLPLGARAFSRPRLSPDGQRLAFADGESNRRDIWTYDLATEKLTRVTRQGVNQGPLWSRDGRHLTYTSSREGGSQLITQRPDGSGTPASLLTSSHVLWAATWTADSRALLYVDVPPTDDYRVFLLPTDGRSQPLLHAERRRWGPELSPDGRWLAFTSDETGSNEIHVEPFPASGARQQISVDGGNEARWSRDGRELFYRSGPRLFAVRVDTSNGFTAGKPTVLFERQYVSDYDVAPDGRFLMIKRGDDEQAQPRLHVVVNWVDELVRRVPTGK
jgi:serine/threonine-protein kinase